MGEGKGLTDDQLQQAIKTFGEIQEMIGAPQVKDTAALRGFLAQLEGVSTAQLVLGLLLKAGGSGGKGGGSGTEGREAGKEDEAPARPSARR